MKLPAGAALAAALGAAMLPGPVSAQMQLITGPGAEFLAVGASRLATGTLDDRLAAQGYPTFGRTALAVSLGGYRVVSGGWTLGAEWHGLVHGNKSHAGREVGLGGGYGTIGVGYAVELSPRARVYPRLGLGVGGLGLWIESPQEAVGFDEVLGDPDRFQDRVEGVDRETTLNTGGIVVDLGAGAELLSRAQGRGAMIGVRLGYLAMPFGTSWRLYKRPVRDAPNATLAGPYIRVVVGTGRSR